MGFQENLKSKTPTADTNLFWAWHIFRIFKTIEPMKDLNSFEIKHLNIFLLRMSAYLAPDPGTPASPDEVKQYIPKPNLS